jgi:catechol 2,3-dioxygenase-like lactoylglutathione lyase family enzyme
MNGVLEVALYVDDIDRALAFYQSVLGFDLVDGGERLFALRIAERQLLLLCKRRASAAMPLGAHDADGRQHVAFAIAASDLPSWETRLAERGVAIEERRQWPRGGVSLYFRDPDGHLLELATPGVWSIY